MKVEIKNYFRCEVIFSVDVDGKTESIRLGLAVKAAIKAGANLSYANLSGANLPSPTTLLLSAWGTLSTELTADLMEYDAASHPDRAAFDKWANGGGPCPYQDVKVRRAANFRENKELWGKGKLRGAYSLMLDLFKEANIKF